MLKIKKEKLYFISLLIFFFFSYNCTVYGFFVPKYFLLAIMILSILLILFLNFFKKEKIILINLLITLTIAVLIFIYCFRNIDLSNSILNGTWYFILFIMIFILQFSSEWIKSFVKVIKIYTYEHLFFTFFCLVFKELYLSNILPLFKNMDGYSDLLNQYRGNMIAGFTGNYGINATYLTIGFLIFFAMLLTNKEKKKINLLLVLLLFIASLITGKRGPIIFGLITAVSSYLFIYKEKINKKIFNLSISVIGFLVLFVLLSPYIPELKTVIMRLSASDNLLNGRESLYSHAIHIFYENPLFGIGWGNFKYSYAEFMGISELLNVHNSYLQLLCETGLIGFTIIIFVIFKNLIFTYKMLKKDDNTFSTELTISILLQVYTILISITSTPFYGVEVLFVYMVSCIIPYAIFANKKL